MGDRLKDGSGLLDYHPVNRGEFCPKGLPEHYTIHAEK
jgi:hypothetical protein